MNYTYILQKGTHAVKVQEIGEKATIMTDKPTGWIDAIELFAILQGNGYRFIN